MGHIVCCNTPPAPAPNKIPADTKIVSPLAIINLESNIKYLMNMQGVVPKKIHTGQEPMMDMKKVLVATSKSSIRKSERMKIR